VALPSELPPACEPALPPAAEQPLFAPAAQPAMEGVLPFEIDDAAWRAARPGRQPTRPPTANVRHLSHEEKERRRLIRNLAMMTVGILVLVIAAVVLSRI
jgi:hypothetical protein